MYQEKQKCLHGNGSLEAEKIGMQRSSVLEREKKTGYLRMSPLQVYLEIS